MLTTAILMIVTLPTWGKWIADYPSTINASSLPAQAQPVAGAIGTVFGPLLHQVGGYIQTAGYFIGSLLTIIGLVISGAGISILRSNRG
jgi:hypothetical protein